MSEQQADLLELVAAYLQRTGRENNERNRLNAIYTNPAWAKRWPAYKAAQKKAAMNQERPKSMPDPQKQALVTEWLAFENNRRKEHNNALTTGVGVPMLEIGYSNGQVTFENAVFAAEQWFEERQQDYDDALLAAGRTRSQYIKAENERANRLIHQPMDSNDPIYQKYKVRLTPITDAQIDDYAKWPVEDLRRAIEFTKYQAGLEINLNGALTEHEWACLTRWVQTQGLDPMGIENWTTGALILTEHQVIRRKDLGPITVDVEPPKLPEVTSRPAPETVPTGRAAETAQREKDLYADIAAAFGNYLDEVNSKQAESVAAPILFRAYDTMLLARSEITRESVRKHLFQAALQFGQKLDGYDDSEIESFNDQAEMRQVSAEEAKRQLSIYGDVRLSRVPSKQNALLEEIARNTRRKS